MNKVYVRDFATRSIFKEFDVSHVMSYDRFVMGLMRKMDLDKFFLDDEDYLKEQLEKEATK